MPAPDLGREAEAGLDGFTAMMLHVHRARHQEDEGRRIASVERHAGDGGFIDRRSQFRRGGVDHLGIGNHADGLCLARADFEAHILGRRLVDRQHDAGLLVAVKAGGFDGQRIIADRQGLEQVGSNAVCFHGQFEAGIDIGEGYGRSGNGAPG